MRATIRCVVMNISVTVMFAASDVSFTMLMRLLPSVGKAVRNAWGRMMRRIVCMYVIPLVKPASSCPVGTDSSAARIVSAQ